MCIKHRKYRQKWQRTWLWKMETNSHYSWYIQNPSSSAERGQIDDSTQKEVHVLGHTSFIWSVWKTMCGTSGSSRMEQLQEIATVVMQKTQDIIAAEAWTDAHLHHPHHLLWHFFVGMQQIGIQLVCQTLHHIYRHIVGNLPHCTRETHFTVLERFHIEPPLIVVHKLANQAHQSLTEALTMVHSHDVIHRSIGAHWTLPGHC